MELVVDPERNAVNADATGIYVRAKLGDAWGAHDIATLTKDSVQAWLAGRPAEYVIAVLIAVLGHR